MARPETVNRLRKLADTVEHVPHAGYYISESIDLIPEGEGLRGSACGCSRGAARPAGASRDGPCTCSLTPPTGSGPT